MTKKCEIEIEMSKRRILDRTTFRGSDHEFRSRVSRSLTSEDLLFVASKFMVVFPDLALTCD